LPATTTPRPNRRRTRNLVRFAHLAAGGVLGTFVYAPDSITDPMQLAMQIAGIPLLALTGLYMWKPALFRRQSPVPSR
jgi:hypothetical protein